ncbi:hypothetical protein IQ07DRAFT_670787 [Pyrenochaeta sp. DS3sAY3a]|nr:hypothetical protein IQ07DRAFT_670787 [Pyrenochaeta sp. DS3sAY3a]
MLVGENVFMNWQSRIDQASFATSVRVQNLHVDGYGVEVEVFIALLFLATVCQADILHVWESDSDIDNLLQLSSVIAKVCNLCVRDNKDIQDSDIYSFFGASKGHTRYCVSPRCSPYLRIRYSPHLGIRLGHLFSFFGASKSALATVCHRDNLYTRDSDSDISSFYVASKSIRHPGNRACWQETYPSTPCASTPTHTQRPRRWFVAYTHWAFVALSPRSRSSATCCILDIAVRRYRSYCSMGISSSLRNTLLGVTLDWNAAYFDRDSVVSHAPYVQFRGCIVLRFSR